jgi:hypothetical protein
LPTFDPNGSSEFDIAMKELLEIDAANKDRYYAHYDNKIHNQK